MSSEDLANFAALTGSDTDVATTWLEMAGGNLEVAVSLFLDNGEPAAASAAPPMAPAASAASLPPGMIMPEGVDAATAAAIAAAAAPPPGASPAVRAPIAAKRQRLFDDGHVGGLPQGQ